MIYTKLTNKALRLAYAAHHGQVDKCGIPYICHPLHLAESMDDEFSCCAALLHDVVEDTDVTMETLEQQFPNEVTDALKLLTHGKDIPYLDYVRALKDHPIARKVKLADLAHNCDQSRFAGTDVSPETLESFRKKYAAAYAVLNEK